MADQKRWFKVWTSIINDPSFLSLNVADLGRCVLLGSWIAMHGHNGQIETSIFALAHILRCDKNEAIAVLKSLPGIVINDNKYDNSMITNMITNMKQNDNINDNNTMKQNDNDKIIVSMKNWLKYQKDSTGYERLKKWRETHHDNTNDNGDKKRGEKTKKRKENNTSISPEYFQELLKRFPNKDGSKMALKHFMATVKTEDDLKNINIALDNYLAHLETETWKKPKNCSTWFNNWQDWIDKPITGGQNNDKGQQDRIERLRKNIG